jgi:hypothetical protein
MFVWMRGPSQIDLDARIAQASHRDCENRAISDGDLLFDGLKSTLLKETRKIVRDRRLALNQRLQAVAQDDGYIPDSTLLARLHPFRGRQRDPPRKVLQNRDRTFRAGCADQAFEHKGQRAAPAALRTTIQHKVVEPICQVGTLVDPGLADGQTQPVQQMQARCGIRQLRHPPSGFQQSLQFRLSLGREQAHFFENREPLAVKPGG